MRYAFKLGNSEITASRIINRAHGAATLKEIPEQCWRQKLRSGDESLQNELLGRPETIREN